MDYEKLKSKLKETSRSWAKELAKEIGCSHNLVYQVCSGTKSDCKEIIPRALEKIKTYQSKIQQLNQQLEEATR